VKAYNTEYGKYPAVSATPPSSTNTDDVTVGESTVGANESNAGLFYVLRAKDDGSVNASHKYNPRKIVFFDGKAASDPTTPKSGFADGSGASKPGAFFDPWGNQYCITIDTNYDNQIQLGNSSYKDFQFTSANSTTNPAPQTGVAAYSLGKDGIVGSKNTNGSYKSGSTTSDDIISWQ
jgi:hypothetical protein